MSKITCVCGVCLCLCVVCVQPTTTQMKETWGREGEVNGGLEREIESDEIEQKTTEFVYRATSALNTYREHYQPTQEYDIYVMLLYKNAIST